MTSGPPSDEAQRELERRALRNVRGLVDKLEQTDEADARAQRRLLIAIVGGAVLVAVLIAAVIVGTDDRRGTKVAIDPSKLPPVRAGPPTPVKKDP